METGVPKYVTWTFFGGIISASRSHRLLSTHSLPPQTNRAGEKDFPPSEIPFLSHIKLCHSPKIDKWIPKFPLLNSEAKQHFYT